MRGLNTNNINSLWADLLLEQLCRHGAACICLSPGSRSAPLALAAGRCEGVKLVVHYDERGAAFFALGYALATGRPAIWITTSGSAVANGFPAVVEASRAGVPLILLTADRPPELRDTGANQTIDQVKLFGSYVRWHVDVPCPTTDIKPQYLCSTARQAVTAAVGFAAGPVHLNCMFREPLDPSRDGTDYTEYLSSLEPRPLSKDALGGVGAPAPAPPQATVEEMARVLRECARGLLVVGTLRDARQVDSVRTLAGRVGWPVLASVTSGLRIGAAVRESVPAHSLALSSAAFAAAHRPEAVLHVGGAVVSKQLLLHLEASAPSHYLQVKDHPWRADPLRRVTASVSCDLSAFCESVVPLLDGSNRDPNWLVAWRDAGEAAAQAAQTCIESESVLTEPKVAQRVTSLAGEGDPLFLASSMPVRDADMFTEAAGSAPRVFSNRGASGIDGSIATPLGIADALGRPTLALLGDLAFLHDLNSLHLARQVAAPVVLVVVNNNGGGIFHFLPIAEYRQVFEPLFATPHGLSFEQAAALFGLSYKRPVSPEDLDTAVREGLGANGVSLIEVQTDRHANVSLHDRIYAAVRDAVQRPLR